MAVAVHELTKAWRAGQGASIYTFALIDQIAFIYAQLLACEGVQGTDMPRAVLSKMIALDSEAERATAYRVLKAMLEEERVVCQTSVCVEHDFNSIVSPLQPFLGGVQSRPSWALASGESTGVPTTVRSAKDDDTKPEEVLDAGARGASSQLVRALKCAFHSQSRSPITSIVWYWIGRPSQKK